MDLLSFLFEKKVLAILLFTIVSVVVAIVIVLSQKKPKVKEEKDESYSDKIKRLLNHKNSEQKLALMDSLFKEFLAKKYNIHEKLELYEIEKKFESDAKIVNFCKLMIEAYYSGETISESVVNKIYQSLEKIVVEEKPVEQRAPKKFSFFRQPEQKYYDKKDHIPIPPSKVAPTVQENKVSHEEHKLRHGRDQHDNMSVFADKEKAAHAKHHLHHAKHHLNHIKHSLAHSKNGTLNENLSIAEWADSLSEAKTDIIDNCKKVLSKL